MTRSLLASTASALAVHRLVKAGDPVARVRGPLGAGTTLNAATDVDVAGWPGLQVRLHTRIPQVKTGIAAGAEHGELTLSTGGGEQTGTVLRADTGMQPPSVWDRIRHHR